MLNNNTKQLLREVSLWVFFWACASLLTSIIKIAPDFDNCGKTYPIDYVLYTNLFCEIKEGD